jgi:ankyrin repeat protein
MGQQYSLLMEAAKEGKAEEVKQMLPSFLQDGGVNGTPYVHIALIVAVEAGREEVVKVLLATGAHPLYNLPQRLEDVMGGLSGQTALSAAVRKGHAKCAELLRAAVCHRGEIMTSLQCLCKRYLVKLQQLTCIDENVHDSAAVQPGMGWTEKSWQSVLTQALHKAAAAGWSVSVQLYIEAGVPVDAMDKDNVTALHKACQAGHVETVKKLLQLRAEVEWRSSDGRSALHYAAIAAVPSAHSAAATKVTAVAELLLGAGASINARDKKGYTVLHVAARANNVALVQMLVDAGADPFAVNLKGELPGQGQGAGGLAALKLTAWRQQHAWGTDATNAAGSSQAQAAGPSVATSVHLADATVSLGEVYG